MQADVCVICAEPLLFTAFGSCGHKDACSKCIIRLRSVLKDPRCVYCQQQLPIVYVTRYAGDFTHRPSLNDAKALEVRSRYVYVRSVAILMG